MPEIRLQKYLADRGIASRREADRWVAAGWVKVNGKVAVPGTKVDPERDRVEADGRADDAARARVYYKYHKPYGIHTVNAPVGEQEIADVCKLPGVFPVGRLDKDSTGLVILTNDGRVSSSAFTPDSGVEKEYLVDTYGPATDAQVMRAAKGGIMLERPTKPCAIERVSSGTLRIVISEGMNRQIRRMFDFVGMKVKNLRRVRVGAVVLGTLKEGEHRPLSNAERDSLLSPRG